MGYIIGALVISFNISYLVVFNTTSITYYQVLYYCLFSVISTIPA